MDDMPRFRMLPRFGSRAGYSTGQWFAVIGLVVAILVLVPIVAVLLELRQPISDTWRQVAVVLISRYALNTLQLALGVVLLSTALGVGAAYLTAFFDFPGRRWLQWLLVLPIAIPAYVLAYIYYDMLSVSGPVQSFWRDLPGTDAVTLPWPGIASIPGAILVLSLALYPYVYIAAWSAFRQQGQRLLEQARLLGCSRRAAFWLVTLPMARPAIVAGMALVVMETLAEYGALSLLGVQTLTTGIYRAWFGMGDRVAAAQLAAILIVVVAILLWLERSQRRGKMHDTRHRGDALADRLGGVRGLMATLLCLMPVIAGFALPVFYLALQFADAGFIRSGQLVSAIANTVTVALLTMTVALIAGVVIVYGERLAGGRHRALINRVAAMGYAVPGPVLAIGALIPLSAIDRAGGGVIADLFGTRPQLWLTGTIFALIYVYLVRFMTISLNGIEAGFGKIKPSLDEAAATLGYGVWSRLWHVYARLLTPSLAAAGTLLFVDVVKELPATLILRPFDFETLAVQVYSYASDERLAAAAAPGLILVLVGLAPVWLLTRPLRA